MRFFAALRMTAYNERAKRSSYLAQRSISYAARDPERHTLKEPQHGAHEEDYRRP